MNDYDATVSTTRSLLRDMLDGKAKMVVDNPLDSTGNCGDTVVLTNCSNPFSVLSRPGGVREFLHGKERILEVLGSTSRKCYVFDENDEESEYIMEIEPAELAGLVEEIL